MLVSVARPAIIVVALVAALSPARAQDPRPLPPVTVDAPPPSPLLPSPSNPGAATAAPALGGGQAGGNKGRCTEAKGETDTSFGCINERLRRKVDEVNPPVLNLPPIDAKSSDLKVGTVNIPAVQQQYGRNFGHSAVPYRPTVIYPSGMGHR
ncbi:MULTISPECIES: hypothetical protein [unclassified Bradyrhizobium]|uniref:hypothetical protein n=1 Tax=unclassified Bradyrhizobium TaxID=2631580 RepID=UPI0028E84E96|nr:MULTISPECIES: hypothetical protein [unclassified Bradyrhizobium]